MRMWLLIVVWLLVPGSATAQTLLETVLYVVSVHEALDNDYVRVTIDQDDRQLRSEKFAKGRKLTLMDSVHIEQLDDCRFEIDHRLGVFSARYRLDLSAADVSAAHQVMASNWRGRKLKAVTIPGALYCLHSGSPFLNAIAPGTCRTGFDVETVARASDADFQKMLTTIRRLGRHCTAKVS